MCADQLGVVFTWMFQLFLNVHFMPHSWKMSTIMHVPKRPSSAKKMNYFRPVALTSSIAVADRMGPLQFACYRTRRVGDATLTLFDLISSPRLCWACTSNRPFKGLLDVQADRTGFWP